MTSFPPRAAGVPDRDADARLLARLAAGDMDAAGELYDRHAGQIYGLARRILQDETDAEDIVQDVFSQAWKGADRYESGRASVLGWLLMMTRTRSIDRLRARQARPDIRGAALPDTLTSSDTAAPDTLMASEQAGLVRDALLALSAPQRTVLELAYYEGLTQVEIAARLSEPLGTVKTRVRTALGALRRRLA